jgi:hypothetical protein
MDQSAAPAPNPPTGTIASARIVVPWSARVFALLRTLLGLFIALAAFGIAIGDAELLGDEFTFLALVELVTAAIVLPFAVISSWSNLRAAFARRARLEVLPDRLAIYHGGVFSEPLAVARDDIEAAWFDHRPFRYKRSGDHQRFDLTPDGSDEERPLRWLYSRAGGAPLPLLGQVFDVPNFAVLFTEPKILRPVRRWQKAFPSKIRMAPPLHKRKSRGLMARLQDPRSLREGLEPWGVVRPITWDMLDSHAPPESDRLRARRSMWRDNAFLFVLVLGQASIPVIIALNN